MTKLSGDENVLVGITDPARVRPDAGDVILESRGEIGAGVGVETVVGAGSGEPGVRADADVAVRTGFEGANTLVGRKGMVSIVKVG